MADKRCGAPNPQAKWAVCDMEPNHTGPHSWEAPASHLVRVLGPKIDALVAAMSSLTTALQPPGQVKK